MNLITFLGIYFFISALFIAQPWFSRRNVVFGVVFADDQIWKNDNVRKIIRAYLISAVFAVFAILIILAPLVAAGWTNDMLAFNLSLALLILVETLVFYAATRKTRAYKQMNKPDPELSSRNVIVAVKGDKETLFPLSWLLILLPLMIATFIVAILGYPYMPSSIPTHFGLTGPDHWAPKSWMTVLSPVFFELMLAVLVLFIRRAPASVKGNPKAAPDYARFRKLMTLLMIVTGLITELIFLVIVISFIHPVSQIWLIAPTIAVIILLPVMMLIYFRFARSKTPSGPILDDDAKWLWGQFYFNRSDPSLFVEKRVGIGYTINMARPGAWMVVIGIITVAILLSVWSR
ncbi:DUF1648 domain-containing protein [Sporolactobacillus vineae]|uniref:DUF1648 domain-containing protein n=1 Tax=Sporolactobacillus vineae TaxID=444463 RepID=UPI000288D847|nr:DUF5808 domain-containing protein [Sporolactobacillus vineae]